MPARELRGYARATIHTAVIWDVLGAFGVLPPWWPPVSYVLIGAGTAAACLSILLVTLSTRRPAPAVAPLAPEIRTGASRRQAGQLLAIGILIVGWLLRGHAEIPPDLPIVVAEIAAAALFAFFTVRRQ